MSGNGALSSVAPLGSMLQRGLRRTVSGFRKDKDSPSKTKPDVCNDPKAAKGQGQAEQPKKKFESIVHSEWLSHERANWKP